MIQFNVRRVGSYLEVKASADSVEIDLGLLNDEEVASFITDLEELIKDLCDL